MMKEMDVTSLWIGMLAQLKQALPPTIYNTWIEPSLLPYSYENNQLILDTAQQFLRTYLSKNYLEDLKQAALAVTGTPTEIKLICSAKEPIPTEPAVAETIHIKDTREPQSVDKKRASSAAILTRYRQYDRQCSRLINKRSKIPAYYGKHNAGKSTGRFLYI